MSKKEIQSELQRAYAEPLLPVEKKLIGWSLGVGLALLALLVLVNHLIPVKI